MAPPFRSLALALLAGSGLWVAGCRKASDPAPLTPAQLLTARPWRLSGLVFTAISPGDTITSDRYVGYGGCIHDNGQRYYADGTGFDDEGPMPCEPADPPSSPFGWTLENNATELVYHYPAGHRERVRIVQLTATTLTFVQSTASQQIPGGPVVEFRHTVTFTAN